MLHLLTRPPKLFFPGCVSYYLKAATKKALLRRRGPDGVVTSLVRGLDAVGYKYSLNKMPASDSTVHVLSNIEALKWAIETKKNAQIKHLIVGPNLVIVPNEHQSILASPEIDAILIPSEWTREFYASLLPTMKNKIHIWPAGIEIKEINKNQKRSGCIVFKKTVDENTYNEVVSVLKKRKIDSTVIEYGKFTQKHYFDLLSKVEFMVYLQESESQGIALQEAWGHDVPTLVWNKGFYIHPDGYRITGKVSAPFLTDEAGMFFTNKDEFESKLTEFVSNLKNFSPREYCARTLSDKASISMYTDVLNHID